MICYYNNINSIQFGGVASLEYRRILNSKVFSAIWTFIVSSVFDHFLNAWSVKYMVQVAFQLDYLILSLEVNKANSTLSWPVFIF